GSLLLAVSRTEQLALLREPRRRGERVYGTLIQTSFSSDSELTLAYDVLEADWAPDETAAILRQDQKTRQFRLEYPIGHERYTTDNVMHDLRLSPDGKAVAMIIDSGPIGRGGEVVVFEPPFDKPRTLTQRWDNARGLAWTRDGREIWFTAGEQEGRRV